MSFDHTKIDEVAKARYRKHAKGFVDFYELYGEEEAEEHIYNLGYTNPDAKKLEILSWFIRQEFIKRGWNFGEDGSCA